MNKRHILKSMLIASVLTPTVAFSASQNLDPKVAMAKEQFLQRCTAIVSAQTERETKILEEYLNVQEAYKQAVDASINAFNDVENCLVNALNTGLSFGASVPNLNSLASQAIEQVGKIATQACNQAVSNAKGKVSSVLSKYSVGGLGDKLLQGKKGGPFADILKGTINKVGVSPSLTNKTGVTFGGK